ncbi:hypothetical protein J4216_00995 [Candidatus Woesearchaeota archaeon]|nr:hypothetical protein [Candidatus Woesearchaeota archaeon]
MNKKKVVKKVNRTVKEKRKRLTEKRDIAMDFAGRVYKKFRDVVKAIAMFGSVPKLQDTPKSDLDIIIIIDDCTVNWDEELIAWYRQELSKLIAEINYGLELHVNTVTLTAFWEEVRAGEPLVINILRYGEPLIDIGGFFDPLKILLAKGRIKPSAEAIFTTMERTGQHLARANTNILNSIEGFYWAMVDASHACLMSMKIVPPSPEFLYDLLEEHLVKNKTLDKKYLMYFDEVRKLAKKILHAEKTKLSGREIEETQNKSEAFVKELNEISKALIRNEKIIKINYKF